MCFMHQECTAAKKSLSSLGWDFFHVSFHINFKAAWLVFSRQDTCALFVEVTQRQSVVMSSIFALCSSMSVMISHVICKMLPTSIYTYVQMVAETIQRV